MNSESEKIWDFTCDGNSRHHFVPCFLLVFFIFLLSLISSFQIKDTKPLLFLYMVRVVCVTVCNLFSSSSPFFFVGVCLSGPCPSDSKGMERAPQAIQSDLIKRE